MQKVHFLSHSLADTHAIAESLLAAYPHGILALCGDLGSGKTALSQAIGDVLGVTEPVASPTFTLINEYHPRQGTHYVHADLYRLPLQEIVALGLEDYFNRPNTLVVVEWADRAPHIFPPQTLWLTFTLTPSHRVLTLTSNDQSIWSGFLV